MRFARYAPACNTSDRSFSAFSVGARSSSSDGAAQSEGLSTDGNLVDSAVGLAANTVGDTEEYPLLVSLNTSVAVIYGLVDPHAPGLIRYVGRTAQAPALRLAEHVRTAHRRTHKDRWVATLIAAGRFPDMVLLQTAPASADLAALEGWWIATLRSRGQADTNRAAPAGFLSRVRVSAPHAVRAGGGRP